MELIAIGRMEAPPENSAIPDSSQQARRQLVIAKEYTPGLAGLEDHQYLQVTFASGKAPEYQLRERGEAGEMKGVFASRDPRRPSGLRVAILRLLAAEDNLLLLEGEAIEPGSQVYDLMPAPDVEADQARLELQQQLAMNPRQEFVNALCADDRARLLIKAAEIHSHFCPGVALGVMASICGLRELGVESQTFDGIMENLLAIVEINACFADGVQAVSGCTLGNNALVFRDLGRTAVTFARRGRQKGLRVRVKPEFKGWVEKLAPEFYPLLEKVIIQRQGSAQDLELFKDQARQAAFGIIELDFEELFATQWVKPVLPGYAPISPLVICPQCNEAVLAGKTIQQGEYAGWCSACASEPTLQVDGRGIVRQ